MVRCYRYPVLNGYSRSYMRLRQHFVLRRIFLLRGGQIIAKILKVEGTDFISHYPNVGNVIGDAADEGIRIITT